MTIKEDRTYDILPVLLCGLSVPLSMFMWLGNVAFTKLSYTEHLNIISPMRWLFSILVPLLLMIYGFKRKGVNKSGAILGLIFAVILSIANHAFLASLATFFFSSSRATKFRSERKIKIEDDFKEGGQRNWAQVLCNAGMATQLAILYLIDCGSGETPINFHKMYRSSWLSIGILAAFACSNGDTWASELGTVIGKSNPFLITTRKSVPRGTNGGVTIFGLLASLLGGLAIGATYYLTIIYTVETNILLQSSAQWPIILFGGFAGIFGSIVDSILGATLQYSGQDEKGHIVERPGKNVRYICGRQILDNHSVNLISSIITGVFVPWMAVKCWP